MSLHLGYLNLVLLVQVTTYIVYDVWSSFQVFFYENDNLLFQFGEHCKRQIISRLVFRGP